MIIGNQQPYLFPYIGYWQLINLVDMYVIADNVQYIKKGYINKNYILLNNKSHRFTLEAHGVHFGKLISEIKVGNNAKKILKTIFHAYTNAPYFSDVYPMLENILLNDEKNLAKYVGYSIKRIADYLNIDTKFINESDLDVDCYLAAQQGIINICKIFDADQYINAIGGQKLYNKERFGKDDIVLNFLKTEEIIYKQFNDEFISNLSIIDVMMFNSKDEIKNMLERYKLV